jgi:hypothetical protein
LIYIQALREIKVMYLLFGNVMHHPALKAVISNPAGVRNPCGDGGLPQPAGIQAHKLEGFLDPAKNAGSRYDIHKSEPAFEIS